MSKGQQSSLGILHVEALQHSFYVLGLGELYQSLGSLPIDLNAKNLGSFSQIFHGEHA